MEVYPLTHGAPVNAPDPDPGPESEDASIDGPTPAEALDEMNRYGRRHPERKRSKHVMFATGWRLGSGEIVAFDGPVAVSRTKRRPWRLRAARRAANRRARAARKANR